ncbi:hypothetical protein DespoDRAFT_01863 [Desulfobacter postgatei 2ac9]|uniref:Uncharacterized protein n=1 Tax=Desulfobacter postgatei 2ac9 TaxID=879212 RepID=I5B2R0_9BACT|nr:hypothetical protein DespoDRAFT_01863 [Desulfobacter postgatei 2ac9]
MFIELLRKNGHGADTRLYDRVSYVSYEKF